MPSSGSGTITTTSCGPCPHGEAATDEFGASALHHAAKYGSEACIHVLAESGADADACDDDGCTPADLAEENARPAAVSALRRGATATGAARLLLVERKLGQPLPRRESRIKIRTGKCKLHR